jgi:hypothetical protein
MRRTILGVLALCSLLVGAVAHVYGVDTSDGDVLASGALRCGMLLGAIWLALPQLQTLRWPPWTILSAFAAFATLVFRPRLLLIVLPIIGLVAILQFARWLLQPLPKKKSG